MCQFDFYMAVCVDREAEYKKRVARRGLYFANFWSISNAIARGRTNTKTLSGRRLIEIPVDVFTYNGTIDWFYSA